MFRAVLVAIVLIAIIPVNKSLSQQKEDKVILDIESVRQPFKSCIAGVEVKTVPDAEISCVICKVNPGIPAYSNNVICLNGTVKQISACDPSSAACPLKSGAVCPIYAGKFIRVGESACVATGVQGGRYFYEYDACVAKRTLEQILDNIGEKDPRCTTLIRP